MSRGMNVAGMSIQLLLALRNLDNTYSLALPRHFVFLSVDSCYTSIKKFSKKLCRVGMVLQKAMKQGRNVHVFHHVMHALTFLTTSRACGHIGAHAYSDFLP